MMRRLPIFIVALTSVWIAAAAAPAGRQGPAIDTRQGITTDTAAGIIRWAHAIDTHNPGEHDAAVDEVWAWSSGVPTELESSLDFFFKVLSGTRYKLVSPSPQETLAAAARDYASNPNRFLERVAVLHADAVVFGSAPGAKLRAGTQDLLSAPPGTLAMAKDGEYAGAVPPNGHWILARRALDMVTPKPVADPFVAAWYHATSAFMMEQFWLGEARPHLDHAARILPGEALIAFDRACVAESMGLPWVQQLVPDAPAPVQTIGAHAMTRTTVPTASVNIPSADTTNVDAERLFRRALELDPSLAEAHARLARLVDLHGRHAEADGEANAAIGARPDPVVAFYAHLFAGRADRARNRASAATGHFQEALALFPDAQSALIARSQLSLVDADVTGAEAPMRVLGDLPVDPASREDPWWVYGQGAGRDADALLNSAWARVRR